MFFVYVILSFNISYRIKVLKVKKKVNNFVCGLFNYMWIIIIMSFKKRKYVNGNIRQNYIVYIYSVMCYIL